MSTDLKSGKKPDHYKAYAGKRGMKDTLTDAYVGYGAFGGKTDGVKVKNAWSNPPLPPKVFMVWY
jgi:hypothetical protein